jgi:hypothetical protein
MPLPKLLCYSQTASPVETKMQRSCIRNLAGSPNWWGQGPSTKFGGRIFHSSRSTHLLNSNTLLQDGWIMTHFSLLSQLTLKWLCFRPAGEWILSKNLTSWLYFFVWKLTKRNKPPSTSEARRVHSEWHFFSTRSFINQTELTSISGLTSERRECSCYILNGQIKCVSR